MEEGLPATKLNEDDNFEFDDLRTYDEESANDDYSFLPVPEFKLELLEENGDADVEADEQEVERGMKEFEERLKLSSFSAKREMEKKKRLSMMMAKYSSLSPSSPTSPQRQTFTNLLAAASSSPSPLTPLGLESYTPLSSRRATFSNSPFSSSPALSTQSPFLMPEEAGERRRELEELRLRLSAKDAEIKRLINEKQEERKRADKEAQAKREFAEKWQESAAEIELLKSSIERQQIILTHLQEKEERRKLEDEEANAEKSYFQDEMKDRAEELEEELFFREEEAKKMEERIEQIEAERKKEKAAAAKLKAKLAEMKKDIDRKDKALSAQRGELRGSQSSSSTGKEKRVHELEAKAKKLEQVEESYAKAKQELAMRNEELHQVMQTVMHLKEGLSKAKEELEARADEERKRQEELEEAKRALLEVMKEKEELREWKERHLNESAERKAREERVREEAAQHTHISPAIASMVSSSAVTKELVTAAREELDMVQFLTAEVEAMISRNENEKAKDESTYTVWNERKQEALLAVNELKEWSLRVSQHVEEATQNPKNIALQDRLMGSQKQLGKHFEKVISLSLPLSPSPQREEQLRTALEALTALHKEQDEDDMASSIYGSLGSSSSSLATSPFEPKEGLPSEPVMHQEGIKPPADQLVGPPIENSHREQNKPSTEALEGTKRELKEQPKQEERQQQQLPQGNGKEEVIPKQFLQPPAVENGKRRTSLMELTRKTAEKVDLVLLALRTATDNSGLAKELMERIQDLLEGLKMEIHGKSIDDQLRTQLAEAARLLRDKSTQIKIISAVHRTGPDHRPVEQVAIEVSKHIKDLLNVLIVASLKKRLAATLNQVAVVKRVFAVFKNQA